MTRNDDRSSTPPRNQDGVIISYLRPLSSTFESLEDTKKEDTEKTERE